MGSVTRGSSLAGGAAGLVAVVVFGLPRTASANCIADLSAISGEADQQVYFPNWSKAYGAAFAITEYGSTCGGACAAASWCGAMPAACGGTGVQIAGLTIQNFGTARSGFGGSPLDIAGVYWRTDCDAAGVYHTMTAIAPDTWTWCWNGTEANPNLVTKAGVCALRVYADIAGTPTDGATVQLGVPYDPVWGVGGFTDTCYCNAFWTDVTNPVIKTIYYTFKTVDLLNAAPGDTLNYTIYYGRPGAGSVTNLEILDTQPPFTHYLANSANPPPDPGWDPDPGPPLRLRWTIPGPLPTGGGPTGAVSFQLTVDWGNGESFEPGSGDVAAPEGYALWNKATATFPNLAAGQRVHNTNQTRTVVMRYLFWKLGDRDVVYNCAPSVCDEITYSIFLKNLSTAKTWWRVSIWDTVPVQLDPWQPGFGLDDPCVGWTMTPSGCAAASPGKVLTGGNTILTWRLDMPPGMTLTLQWKAQVRPAATVGATATNRASIQEEGRSGVVEGTGHAGGPRNFTHLAPVVLRTSYVSYVSYDVNSCFGANGQWYFISFYPLHPSAVWQLYFLDGACGLNASINAPAAALPCNAWPGAGCPVGPERRPQLYGWASATTTCAAPENHLYKLMSNAPILWEVNPNVQGTPEDSMMYSTATTLTFRGYTLYTFRRQDETNPDSTHGDYLGIANTEAAATTVHLFLWDAGNVTWQYQATRTIDPSSQWMTGGTPAALAGHWRIISSDTNLIVWKGYALAGITDYDNYVTMAPAATNGNLTGGAGQVFYAYDGQRYGGNAHANTIMVLTNVGPAAANYTIDSYVSAEPLLTTGAVPPILGGASGSWVPVDSGTIPFGQAAAGNPHIFGRDACEDTKTDFTETFTVFRVAVTSGGPIQVRPGRGGPGRYGGYVLHGLDSGNNPVQAVDNFWHSQVGGDNGNDIVAFCPSTGMAVRCTTEDGYSATYTTNGPDQPILFCGLTTPAASCGSNFKVDVLAPVGGRVIGMVNGTYFTERHYAAPFLSTGVHYEIIAPPVVFVGQSFWITVVVLNVAGGTKTDYCGTTSFTSTDPTAKIESTGMDSYNFTWSSLTACKAAPDEDGVRVFVNVSMTRLGIQTIVASDLADGSITGLTAILVVGADVKISKEPRLQVAASSDTVQFRVCWSNFSSASAFSFVITDAVPVGTTFLPETSTAAFNCGSTDGVTIDTAYSTSTTASPPTSFTTNNPVAGTRWLRWTVPQAGVQTTGCACYRVTVD